MANKKITDVAAITLMTESDTLFVKQDGDIKQITIYNAFLCNLHNIPRILLLI